MTAPIRVAIVDDEPLVRQGLRTILDSAADIEVVGEAGDGAEALSVVRRTSPDVVCMDVRMPSVDGIRATELLLAAERPPKVLVITTFESDDSLYDALLAGASGFLLKRAEAAHILAAVRTVHAGDSLVLPDSMRRLAAMNVRGRPTYDGPPLSSREDEVLRLIARGMTNAEIAGQLAIGVETVRTHVANLLGKLVARDRTQAVVIAYDTGLLSPGAH
jgi:DNA-binding NarL/FixJ family response regulator